MRIYIQYVGMKFAKVCHDSNEKRKKVKDDGILLPDGHMLHDLGQEDYKYLGVLEVDEIKMKHMKKKAKKEYLRRIKLLLKSKFNGGNVI